MLIAACAGLAQARFTRDAAFFAWLQQVGRRRLIDLARRFGALRRGSAARISPAAEPLEAVEDEGSSPSRDLHRHDARCAVEEILARLPPAYRDVLRQIRIHGLTSKEAAAALGISHAAARRRLERALALCRELAVDRLYDAWKESTAPS
jgi:RNA polymerase sigma-70 factor (ECF subfamily)